MREAIERTSIWFIVLAFGFTVLDFAYEEFLPTMTGWAAPVVSRIDITGIFDGDEVYESRVEGEITKHRTGCVWRKTEWRLGMREDVSIEVLSQTRDLRIAVWPEATRHFEQIFVDMSEGQIRGNSHANVYHKCPYTFWLVKTPLHDGKGRT